jgi:hypothetical protein
MSVKISAKCSNNKTLIHVDFSHCGFSKDECEVMNEGLKQNHTILGLHMIGNEMNTDPLGFLKEEDDNPAVSHILEKVSNVNLQGS